MPCYHPLQAFRTPGGKIVFKPTGLPDYQDHLEIPCGRCVGCKLERSREWAVRCIHEAQMHEENDYLTLTYRDSALPPGGTLIKKHMQDFIKRLRHHFPRKTIRYLMCGEYGEETQRPHYHMILFGIRFNDRKPFKMVRGNMIFTSDRLDEIWGHGYCQVGNVTFKSAAYVARYVLKKQTKNDKDTDRVDPETGEIFEPRLPEYIACSLKPAIGKSWIEKYENDVFPQDFVVIGNRQFPVPKYYRRLYADKNPEKAEEMRAKRIEKAKASPDNSSSRLATREDIQKRRLDKLKRNQNESENLRDT
ncbi:replication initiator protein [Microviridae sp.]|nr:replication initiator protein [Microviridae sp.]